MKLIARTSYSDFFKDEKPSIQELLKGCNKLNFIRDLIALIGLREVKEIQELVSKQSTLRLMEYVLSITTDEQEEKGLDDSVLVKAYLLINEELNQNEKDLSPHHKSSELSKLSHARFILPLTINQHELDGKDLKVRLNAEILKIKILQDYFNNNPHLKELEKLFFEKVGIDSWVNYFFKIQRLAFANAEIQKDSYIVKLDPLTEEDIRFYENLEQIDASIGEYSDFLELRKRPIIRFNHDEYGVLHFPFLYDKIYKSVYFELSQLGRTHAEVLGKKGANFQSDFGKDFFEDMLCKTIVERAFKGKKYFNCIEEDKIGSLTDYYVRNDKKVFLFEFKNSTIPQKVKCSSDLATIEKSLFEKFDGYVDSKNKVQKKAIMQLITCIQAIYEKGNIAKNKFSFKNVDSFLEQKKQYVYPIIVVQDYCLEAMGINYILNEQFKSRLKDSGLDEEYGKQRIKNLTVIHIDSLIYLNDSLRNGVIKLHDLIDEYHRFTHKGKFGNPISFGQFLPKYINNNKKFNTKPDLWQGYLKEFIGH